jgi:hypothetical protein
MFSILLKYVGGPQNDKFQKYYLHRRCIMTSYRRDAFVPITKAHVHSNTHISMFMCCVILYDFIFLIESESSK